MNPESPDTGQESCLDPGEKSALSLASARQRILAAIQPLGANERIPLKQSLGRVLGADINAPFDVPPWDNSAMDGYAVRSADLTAAPHHRLTVVGSAMAGAPFPGKVAAGQCVRIMTGGVIPQDCDTVIIQEHVSREGDVITFTDGHSPGQYVRRTGEDLGAGQRVLAAGRRLSPADLGLLASLGIAHVAVTRRPRVAFFSTGDELRAVGEPLEPGTIYDSNRYALYGMLQQTGVEILERDVARDRRDALQAAIAAAAAETDAVITSGGVSVGDADFVRDSLAELGEVHFWKVGIKPGRPFAFGRIGAAWFFGLPGNPVSTMVTYYQFVQPALRRLMGETMVPALQFKVTCITPLKKTPGRLEFQRGVLETNETGETVVRSTGGQGSNLLSSMSEANCFIILPVEWGDVPAGSLVEVQPFAGL
jgi:molybdopterin molybdotransferase